MFGTGKKSKVRKNRLKKNVRERRARWLGRMLLGLKLCAMIAVLLGVSALYVMGYAAVTGSDYFRSKTIKVVGNSRLSKAEILTQAGVRTGDNILALNLRLVRRRLLDHGWIESARVTREIPQALTIEVKEHEPLARIDWGRQFLVNTQGRIFKQAGPNDPQDLPLVSGIGVEEIGLPSGGATLQAVLKVLQLGRRPASPIAYADMQELRVDPDASIMVILRDQRRIKLGTGQYDLKFERLAQLHRHLESAKKPSAFKVADLTHPDRVVVQMDVATDG
jgi:cell division protein FtsQ